MPPTSTIAGARISSKRKDFLEAGKKQLAGDTIREATSDEVKDLRAENFHNVLAALREIAEVQGVRYVDFRDLPMRFTTELFVNQDHLNNDGARLFAPRAAAACFPDEEFALARNLIPLE